jgi:hypothetical protein
MQLPHQEELNKLEEQIRRLKTQYDLFFAGVRKLPPATDRKHLDEAIRELGKGRLRDNTSRFRYNTLVARYNRYQELWGRQMREREEGPIDFRRRQAAMDAEAPPPEEKPKTRVTSAQDDAYVKVTASSNGDAIKALHRQIAEANKEAGKAVPSEAQVASLVQKQIEQMTNKYKTDSVAFRVETVDGKVRLRAKPLSKG